MRAGRDRSEREGRSLAAPRLRVWMSVSSVLSRLKLVWIVEELTGRTPGQSRRHCVDISCLERRSRRWRELFDVSLLREGASIAKSDLAFGEWKNRGSGAVKCQFSQLSHVVKLEPGKSYSPMRLMHLELCHWPTTN